MAKIFIETFVGLQEGRLGHLPLVCQPGKNYREITIPTDANTQPRITLDRDENIIRVVARANCGFYFRGWPKGAVDTVNSSISPITTMTANATEYFCVPHDEDHDWYNLRMIIIMDQS